MGKIITNSNLYNFSDSDYHSDLRTRFRLFMESLSRWFNRRLVTEATAIRLIRSCLCVLQNVQQPPRWLPSDCRLSGCNIETGLLYKAGWH